MQWYVAPKMLFYVLLKIHDFFFIMCTFAMCITFKIIGYKADLEGKVPSINPTSYELKGFIPVCLYRYSETIRQEKIHSKYVHTSN